MVMFLKTGWCKLKHKGYERLNVPGSSDLRLTKYQMKKVKRRKSGDKRKCQK
jgi:hypothetical protein